MVSPRPNSGLTLVETIIAIVVLGVLVYLAIPGVIGSTCGKNGMSQTFSNQRQLYLVTQAMALDGETTGNPRLGWPGDIGGTFSNWATQLIANDYLSTNDFRKLLSAPGLIVAEGKIPSMDETALRVYTVSSNSADSTVLFTTANFTNTPTGGEALQSSARPYGNKGFVVFRRSGEGAVLLSRQVGQINLIGSFAPLCK